MSDYMSFMADDAFTYVEAYRKAMDWTPEKISSKVAWLQPKINGEDEVDSKVYAEYRGYEHALHFQMDREEPSLVFLGPDKAKRVSEDMDQPTPEEQIEMLQDRVQKLREDLAMQKKAKANAEMDLTRSKHESSTLSNKLANCQAIQYILLATSGAFFFLTILLAFS
ncbi:MAG: hypothetical protein HUJ29_13970 [Gammaproteobacteria bacterium]|nr:hypothetical protein [Gammaproteobacteria bacterium]